MIGVVLFGLFVVVGVLLQSVLFVVVVVFGFGALVMVVLVERGGVFVWV